LSGDSKEKAPVDQISPVDDTVSIILYLETHQYQQQGSNIYIYIYSQAYCSEAAVLFHTRRAVTAGHMILTCERPQNSDHTPSQGSNIFVCLWKHLLLDRGPLGIDAAVVFGCLSVPPNQEFFRRKTPRHFNIFISSTPTSRRRRRHNLHHQNIVIHTHSSHYTYTSLLP
jgi:hypothetical protein